MEFGCLRKNMLKSTTSLKFFYIVGGRCSKNKIIRNWKTLLLPISRLCIENYFTLPHFLEMEAMIIHTSCHGFSRNPQTLIPAIPASNIWIITPLVSIETYLLSLCWYLQCHLVVIGQVSAVILTKSTHYFFRVELPFIENFLLVNCRGIFEDFSLIRAFKAYSLTGKAGWSANSRFYNLFFISISSVSSSFFSKLTCSPHSQSQFFYLI